jgi:uncharacterized protein YdeI (BOF family)
MRSIKSGLFGVSTLGLILATGVSTWAAPIAPTASGPAQAQQQKPAQPQQPMPDQAQPSPTPDQPAQDQAQAATFTGTIVKDGSAYVLKDSSGSVYKLDDASRAQPFEGKSVKVTGKLDTDAKLIHVENIEAVSA